MALIRSLVRNGFDSGLYSGFWIRWFKMIFFSKDGLFGFCCQRAFHGFVGAAKVFPFGEEGSFFQIQEGRGIRECLQAIQGARGCIEKASLFLCEIEIDAKTGIRWFEGKVAL